MVKRTSSDLKAPANPEQPFEHLGSKESFTEEDGPHAKRYAFEKSPTSTAASTPELGPSTSPEARDHAHLSALWQLPVKELKARLAAQGADLRGCTEKTELVQMLEHATEEMPPFEL
mmetsp:Transcript_41772/g.97547  ORF Transcript_41772/g.97547 Transcript_41772/m.97547 type:complete len:117 (-) Transcript_41772:123-473(-)